MVRKWTYRKRHSGFYEVRPGAQSRTEEPWGNKKIIKYSITEKGKDFCTRILEPYEQMFPRK